MSDEKSKPLSQKCFDEMDLFLRTGAEPSQETKDVFPSMFPTMTRPKPPTPDNSSSAAVSLH